MNFNGEEREMLRAMPAITVEGDGHEIFVGLGPTDSEDFLTLSRRNEGGKDLSSDPRFTDLHRRNEKARQRVVDGERPLDPGTHLR